jgi:hypothetical protein
MGWLGTWEASGQEGRVDRKNLASHLLCICGWPQAFTVTACFSAAVVTQSPGQTRKELSGHRGHLPYIQIRV